MLFDQLYADYGSLLDRPLTERRARLEEYLSRCNERPLVLSDAIVGQGIALFREARRESLEGIVAKRLDSRYIPGRRNTAWTKIKCSSRLLCAIIGFVPSGKTDFRNLVLAADDGGDLSYVGRVGTGFDMQLRDQINALLWARLRKRPLITCRLKARWIEPGAASRRGFVRYFDDSNERRRRAAPLPRKQPARRAARFSSGLAAPRSSDSRRPAESGRSPDV
ncbi:MAG: hypothetical protein HY000_26590 [Planctomycetes bacterium]|nr:hypothetical protein [Planctomycetota bacterium]